MTALSCPSTMRICFKGMALSILCFAVTANAAEKVEYGFERILANKSGIDFPGSIARTTFSSTQFIDNAGVAAGDVDGDGLCDLFFCGGEKDSRLYLNKGNFKFEDATASSGLNIVSEDSINAAVLEDGDGDGDLDLFLGSLYSKSVYLINDGKGNFLPSSKVQWQESPIGGITSMTFADIDKDGDLDLYTSRYLNTIVSDQMTPDEFDAIFREELDKIKNGAEISPEFAERFTIIESVQNGRSGKTVNENGLRDILYLNDGRGNFSPALGSETRFRDEAGKPIQLPPDWGLTSTFRDVDLDGDPDLYVCNDFESPDRFWINDGKGYFHPAPKLSLRRTSSSSMGVDFADIDLDGKQDFLVVDMLSRSHALRKAQMGAMVPTVDTIGLIDDRPQIMQNTLFLNRGDNEYSEIAQYAGLKATEWSWAPAFVDIDLDGYKDLVITTGAIRDFMNADINAEFKRQVAENGPFSVEQTLANQKKLPPLPMRNFVFRNRGDMTFEDMGERWGVSDSEISGGMALADLDGDGDLDIAINNTHTEPEIYRNLSRQNRVSVRLKGSQPNTQAIGALLELSSDELTQTHEITSGGIYASGSETLKTFALPSMEDTYTLTVTWPDGKVSTQTIKNTANIVTLEQAQGIATTKKASPVITPLFKDMSAILDFTHHEEPYNDFSHQPLLPNRLSQLGPGISWTDLDQDGDDDLLIPSGRGGKLAIFANTPDGFQKLENIKAFADQTTVLTSASENGDVSFILGISNHEIQNPEKVTTAMPFSFSRKTGWNKAIDLPASKSTTGPLSQADIDGDGDLDLFIGGRAIPGKYPHAADSQIFINEAGILMLDIAGSEAFKKIGLVSASVFGDIDLDGDQDLVLANEWGPIQVFQNDQGKFTSITEDLGLHTQKGWWNGISLGDFDNDGRLDIVATNWGRNSKYEGSYNDEHPLEIFYGDLNGDGTEDVVEAHFDKDMECLVPERGFSCSSRAMPFVRERMKTFEGFGLASLENIYQGELEMTDRVTANTLEHKVFLNRGDHFIPQALPQLAQLSPAFGVCISDMDGDGNEDIFLAQNFFAVQVETPRNDAGYGMLLKGDGKGNFTPMDALESGIKIYGDQRGAALSDFNGDGKVDIVIAQNGAPAKLFQNENATKGLRVRLQGTTKNPNAIGASVQLKFGESWGPKRVITSGSGYWSQNSSTLVLGIPTWPNHIRISWPNGKTEEFAIPQEQNRSELRIQKNGTISMN